MVSTPLAEFPGTMGVFDIRSGGFRAHHHRHLAMPIPVPGDERPHERRESVWPDPAAPASDLHTIFTRIVERTRVATGADACEVLRLVNGCRDLESSVASGPAVDVVKIVVAMQTASAGTPQRVALVDSPHSAWVCTIPSFGALVVTWRANEPPPEPGIVELAARLAAAAVSQERSGTLNLSAWRVIDTMLHPNGDPVVARDAGGRLFFASTAARNLLGIVPGEHRGIARESSLIRTLDLRDQWGVRITPTMLPGDRLCSGGPAPELVVSARHPHGNRHWLLLHAEAVRDGHGRVSLVLTALRDFSVMERYRDSLTLRSRITEHLHRRPIDLAAIERDIAAHIEGGCVITVAPVASNARHDTTHAATPHRSRMLDDAGARELLLAHGHLHTTGPGMSVTTDDAPAPSHVITIPIEGDGELLGHMHCRRAAVRPEFDDDEVELLTELADQLGLALALRHLRESLHAGERLVLDIGQRLHDAEESERRRVGLSIHDGLAQVAVSVYQQLEIIAHRFEPSSAAEDSELQRARELARRTVLEARQLIAGLRPATLDAHGLDAAIREEVDAMRCDGCNVQLRSNLAGQRFDQDLELEVYRVIQEALHNARKHAGATPIEVTLAIRNGAMHFDVRDHGTGFDMASHRSEAAGSHVGLGGMRDRIARLGGSLRVESAPSKGTLVKGDVPL